MHPFLQSLLPEKRYLYYPNLAKAVGSDFLAARVAQLQPDLHLFGHVRQLCWTSAGLACMKAARCRAFVWLQVSPGSPRCSLFHSADARCLGHLPVMGDVCALLAPLPSSAFTLQTHFAWDACIGGTRYIQAPLCSPQERRKRLFTVGFGAW